MAFNTGGHMVRDNLLVMVDASNSKSYPDPTGNIWHNLADGRSRNFINYLGVGVSGSDATQRIVFDSNDYMQYVGTPAGLQGDVSFTVFGAFYRGGDSYQGATWGIGGDTSAQGFGSYNGFGDHNLVMMDFWGLDTYSTERAYPLNQWVLVHWIKDGAGFSTSNCHIWFNDTEYTGGDLTVYRGTGSGTPNVNALGLSLGRAGYSTDNYYAEVDIGFIAFYDRALSAYEINQNFQAKRMRYGI